MPISTENSIDENGELSTSTNSKEEKQNTRIKKSTNEHWCQYLENEVCTKNCFFFFFLCKILRM